MGLLKVAESFVKSMVFILFLLIIAFAVLAYIQRMGGSNIIGRAAQWINDHAQPQDG